MRVVPVLTLTAGLAFLAIAWLRRRRYAESPWELWFLWLHLAAVGLHQFEEYGFPGGFHHFFVELLRGDAPAARFPSRLGLELLNLGIPMPAFGLVGWLGTRRPFVGVGLLSLNLANGFFHLVTAVVTGAARDDLWTPLQRPPAPRGRGPRSPRRGRADASPPAGASSAAAPPWGAPRRSRGGVPSTLALGLGTSLTTCRFVSGFGQDAALGAGLPLLAWASSYSLPIVILLHTWSARRFLSLQVRAAADRPASTPQPPDPVR